MRPDLPWNVAGIPPEAREAARAAARREGLSVGEWLTRRILRSFADAGDEDELTRDSFAASRTYRADEPVPPPSRRETDEMLDRVSRSETESNDVYRRIEEQMRGVARRMESTERSQSENNRALTRAATEMNIATREQSQAFDQLGNHVVGLKERLDRVEEVSKNDSLKEAVKGLHTGLARLADQLGQNANQSATQISSLATNLEAVAGRLGESRLDAETTAQVLENRIATLDDRIYTVEKTSHANVGAVDRAREAWQAAHANHVSEFEQSHAVTSGAIARLHDSVAKLEERGADPELDQRLAAVEKSVADIVTRLEERGTDPEPDQRLAALEKSLADIAARSESEEPTTARAVEDSLKKLLNRVEATENRQRDTVSEFRSVLNETTSRLAALEAKPIAPPAVAFQPAPTSAYAPVFDAPPFDAPPFPDVPTPGAPPPFAAQPDPFLAQAAYDAPPPFPEENPFEPASGFANQAFAAPPAGDSYLSAARRSAQAAASAADAEQASRGFAWGANKTAAPTDQANSGRSRTMLLAFVTLIVIALVAGIVLSQGLGRSSSQPSNIANMFNKPAATPAPQEATPLHATSPQADDIAPHAPVSMPVPATPAPQAQVKPTVLPPLQQKTVAAAPIHAPPAPATATAKPATQTASVSALDHLTALANGGNAKAETVVGLKYLNGDGTAVNEAQAAKWLERAAESGEPVAQYRLGYLYERGKGVAADPAKATHWYQAAAMQGNRKAMHNLAVAFAEGTGTKKDVAEAARWFSKAASLGLTDSQFNLAVLYERGEGVPQSLLDAYKWYAIAAAGGDTESKSRIDALSTQLSADDRAAAQHAVDTFKPQAADPRANTTPTQSDLPQG
jgi:localization factor PodJL